MSKDSAAAFVVFNLRRPLALAFATVLALWCATALRARDGRVFIKPKIAILIADEHYNTEESLPVFSAKVLGAKYNVVFVSGSRSTPDGERSVTFERIKEIEDADLLLVSVTRRAPLHAQLDAIRRFAASRKPIVGIRTANHAFILSPGNTKKPGYEEWPEWDAQVIGGNYSGHHRKAGPVKVSAVAPPHPILKGVPAEFAFANTLYKVSPLQPRTTVLLRGELSGQAPEPMAWLFDRGGGGTTFYLAMGGLDDFANPAFTRCLENAITWLVQESSGR
jgi:hypothetical protein